jgi:hypothetical protein
MTVLLGMVMWQGWLLEELKQAIVLNMLVLQETTLGQYPECSVLLVRKQVCLLLNNKGH